MARNQEASARNKKVETEDRISKNHSYKAETIGKINVSENNPITLELVLG